MTVRILIGDCRETLKGLADASVDSVVCDPPYHLTSIVKRFGAENAAPAKSNGATGVYGRASKGFMGQTWDGGDVAFQPETWAEILRVLKPGGHMVAFSGTRTYHRMVCAIEDAGFEIRDQLAWVYGSGFPKSLDVSKQIDKSANSRPLFDDIRAHVRQWKETRGHSNKSLNEALGLETNGCGMARHWTSTEGGQHMIPSKDQWRNLKRVLAWPDCELDAIYDSVKDGAERPVLGQRKCGDPVAWYGQTERGDGVVDITAPATEAAREWQGWGTALKPSWEPICLARKSLIGTVAANVLAHGTGALNIDGCRIEGESTERHTFKVMTSKGAEGGAYGKQDHEYAERDEKLGTGSPLGRWPANLCHDGSEEVLAGFPETASGLYKAGSVPKGERRVYGQDAAAGYVTEADTYGDSGSAARFFYCAKAASDERGEGNNHPTVKPVALMRWLCRLVTPKGGTVLDPFMGSGSTLIAADAEQFNAIGCEMSPDYAAIAERRMRDAAGMFADVRAA